MTAKKILDRYFTIENKDNVAIFFLIINILFILFYISIVTYHGFIYVSDNNGNFIDFISFVGGNRYAIVFIVFSLISIYCAIYMNDSQTSRLVPSLLSILNVNMIIGYLFKLGDKVGYNIFTSVLMVGFIIIMLILLFSVKRKTNKIPLKTNTGIRN